MENHQASTKKLLELLGEYNGDEELTDDDIFDYLALLSDADGQISKRTGMIKKERKIIMSKCFLNQERELEIKTNWGWITNASTKEKGHQLRNKLAGGGRWKNVFIGTPHATEAYSCEELTAFGSVGLYGERVAS